MLQINKITSWCAALLTKRWVWSNIGTRSPEFAQRCTSCAAQTKDILSLGGFMKRKTTTKAQPITTRTPHRPIKFIKRPAMFFAGFASIAVSAALFAAYPKWHKQETENWVYSYVTDKFPGKGVENLQKLAQIIFRESSKIRLDKASDGHKFDKAALLLGVIQTESEFNMLLKLPHPQFDIFPKVHHYL